MKVILCFRQGRLALRANNFDSGYPLFFQAVKILALRAKKWLSSVSGREDLALRANNWLSSVSGREDLALRANNWLSSVSGREDLALRAKNRLSSVSGREVKCEVLVIWKVNNS